jgi:hypothetical protein
MDIATGLLAGAGVLATLIMLGGDMRMVAGMHAAIVILGGSFAATLIRFPLASIFHGLPLGAKSLRRMTQRDLVDELPGLPKSRASRGRSAGRRSRLVRDLHRPDGALGRLLRHEETKEGLNIEIVDQDGRSMFPDGAEDPYERTRKLIAKMAPALKAMQYRLVHHRPYCRPQGAGQAQLRRLGTLCRAPDPVGRRVAVRPYLRSRRQGRHRSAVPGPYMSPNRRVTITLMRRRRCRPISRPKTLEKGAFGRPQGAQNAGIVSRPAVI